MKTPILSSKRLRSVALFSLISIATLLFMTGCSLLNVLSSSAGETADIEPTVERVVVPTFTQTPESAVEVAVQPTPTAVVVEVVAVEPENGAATEGQNEENVASEADTPLPVEPTPEPTATETAVPSPRLIVTNDIANIRGGPNTAYRLVGTVNRDQSFDLTGKSPDGQWWQLCCVNGQEGWIFGQLARVENAADVQVAQNIPALPVATPVPVQPTPLPPAPTPVPAEPTPAPAPPANDPCANIGGDGCKFRLNGGPSFSPNGGGELKLTLAFVHSGRNDEAQSSYFVVLMKDGVKLPVPDSVRSWNGDKRSGPHGSYNYEYKLGLHELPGNNVAGGYVIWVLDGNGERDSTDFGFNVPDGQGEVWIKFAQSN